ncbi:hypothetical protein PJL18_02553 [Paenarthrobacter nicotinovorans]|nr:hypothetical protein [Paenarthrobacter nicotinovorans]
MESAHWESARRCRPGRESHGAGGVSCGQPNGCAEGSGDRPCPLHVPAAGGRSPLHDGEPRFAQGWDSRDPQRPHGASLVHACALGPDDRSALLCPWRCYRPPVVAAVENGRRDRIRLRPAAPPAIGASRHGPARRHVGRVVDRAAAGCPSASHPADDCRSCDAVVVPRRVPHGPAEHPPLGKIP